MERIELYRDIAERTNGDIYIGVVGPVRTGKSTFIKRFMDMLVLPGMTDEHKKARLTDELPQSAAGTTIMTTQPKFVPDEAVELSGCTFFGGRGGGPDPDGGLRRLYGAGRYRPHGKRYAADGPHPLV